MKQRDAYFDNGKFLLIFLVVFGHLIRSFIEESTLMLAVYNTIYAFHMPAFILISGHFAKGTISKERILLLGKKLLLPYLIFQILSSIFYSFFNNDPLTFNLLVPEWSLWFLLSIFFWNLMLPFFSKMNKGWAMCIAILLGIGIGFVDVSNGFLSISRTFVFFPFFLLGFYMKSENFRFFKNKKLILPGINILVVVFVLFYLNSGFDFNWLYGSKPYIQMESLWFNSGFDRLSVYLLNFALVFSFLALIPTKEYRFTWLGRHTIYVYLTHGFIVRTFRSSDAAQWLASHHLIWPFIVISVAVIIFLSSKYVRAFMQPLIELRANKLRQVHRHFSRPFTGMKS